MNNIRVPENTPLEGANQYGRLRRTPISKGKINILKVQVSRFDSYLDTTPQTIHLLDWLTSDHHAHKIIALRKMKDKTKRDRIKASLPAITVSGIFDPSRKEEYLVRHSGLICIDIDRKENEHITNFSELKYQLFNFQNVAYAGLSASGKGCYLIIPIAYPKQHKAHFRALRKDLADWGVHIDTAPQNVASLRGYSYDPEALFRYDALPYSNLALPRQPKPKRRTKRTVTISNESTTRERVEKLINQIITEQIDITGSEPQWFRLACALVNEFGESGRCYFHDISQFYPTYQSGETDQKYDHALGGRYREIGIGTFFQIAKENGIELSATDKLLTSKYSRKNQKEVSALKPEQSHAG